MSANDTAPDQPAEPQPPGSTPADGAISGPPMDYQTPPVVAAEGTPMPPGWQPELGLPSRTITQKPRPPHPNFWWSWLWCFFFLITTQIPGAVVAGVILAAMVLIWPDQFSKGTVTDQTSLMKSPQLSFALAVAFFITELLVIGVSLLVIRLVVGRDWPRQLAVRRPSLAHTVLAVASLPALVMLGNVAYDFLRNVLHMPSMSDLGIGGMEEMIKVFSQWPWPFAVLVIGVGPGIGEELWCRGFLGRGLVGTHGILLGVLASSFFFGLIHLDPCQGTMAMLMGLWLHFVYLTTRSLWLPMLLHFLNNSFSVVASRIPQLELLDAKAGDIPTLVYLAGGLLLAAVAYGLYQSRARLEAEGTEPIPNWRPPYAGVEYPPSHSGTRVVHPPVSVPAFALAGASFFLFVTACVKWMPLN
jgi:membrane protease YdiL (CAAX protease family)